MSNGTGRKKPSPGPSCEPAGPDVTTATPFQVTSLPLLCLTQMHCRLRRLRPSAHSSPVSTSLSPSKNLTEETFWKVPNPLCVPWFSCPDSQTIVLNGTLVVSHCHHSPRPQTVGDANTCTSRGREALVENRGKASPARRVTRFQLPP